MENITVGMKLYKNEVDKSTESGFKEVIVGKIGRIYFYLNDRNAKGYPIDLKTLYHQNNGWSQMNFQLYRTPQEISNMNELNRLTDAIQKWFYNTRFGKPMLTLDQARQIATILNL